MRIYLRIRWVLFGHGHDVIANVHTTDFLVCLEFISFQNISIAVVGKNEKFHILDDKENNVYVSAIEKRTPASGSSSAPGDVGVGSSLPKPDDPKDDDDAPGDDPQVAVAMETQ